MRAAGVKTIFLVTHRFHMHRARTLFEALCSTYHNELSPENRSFVPRIYFEGNSVDNDALQELLDLLQVFAQNLQLLDAGHELALGRAPDGFRKGA